MQQITRKVISAQVVRQSVERARVHDAWMSTLILLLDPFQRATDRNGAQPCFQPKTENWFDLAKRICAPADELEEREAETTESAEETSYNPERYLDPVYDRYRGFVQ